MNKEILNFNKEIALELKKIIKKTQAYEKEQILKSAKEKGLVLEVLNEGECHQSYLVKNLSICKDWLKMKKLNVFPKWAINLV